jgi:beta-lactamase regulating signal transducer with metallopeptidase domain
MSYALDLAAWLATYAVHSTLLLGAAALFSRVLRRDDWREALWKAALVGGLLTASFAHLSNHTALGGRWALTDGLATESLHVPGASVGTRYSTAAGGLSEPAGAPPHAAGGEGLEQSGVASSGGSVAGAGSWIALLLGIWGTVAVLLLGRLAVYHVRLFRELRDRQPITTGPLPEMLATLRRRAGIWTPVRLTASPRCPTPLVLGRNEICVPTRFSRDLDADQQRSALAHELAHVRRRDPLWQLTAGVLSAVFFFQPLHRLAGRRLREAAEHLCDDWAARQTGSPLGLARCLTSIAGWVGSVAVSEVAVAMAEGGSPLVRRIERLAHWHERPVVAPPLRLAPAAALIVVVAAAAPAVSREAPPGLPSPAPEPSALAATAIPGLASPHQAAHTWCGYTAADTLVVSAAGIRRLRVEVPAGDVRIVGRPVGNTVRVLSRRCGSRPEVLDGLALDMGQRGEELRIKVELPRQLFSRTQGTVARVDLDIEVPQALALDLETSLGSVDLVDVGSVRLRDRLGDVRIAGVAGTLALESGPGDLRIQDVREGVRLTGGVGPIEVEQVGGDVLVTGRTGRSVIRDVQGSVSIQRHGGDVRVERVAGDLTVQRLENGEVQHQEVRGTVRLPRR